MKYKRILNILFIFLNSFCFSQYNEIDTLLKLINKDKEDTNKVFHLYFLSNNYVQLGSFDSALIYANKALELANSLPNGIGRSGASSSYNTLGIIYMQQGDYSKALDNYFKALKLSEELNNKNGMAIQYGNIGNAYCAYEKYSKALEYYSMSLKMAESLGDSLRIAIQLNNIGNVYLYINKFPLALYFYSKSLKMAENINIVNLIAANNANIGSIYQEQAKAITITNHTKDSLNNIALKYHLKSLKLAEEIGNKNGIIIELGNIGLIYIDLKNFKEAEKHILKSLEFAEEIGSLDDIKVAHKSLSDIYEKTNRLDKALEHIKQYIISKDSLFNEEKDNEITRKEMNYEFEKKELTIKAEHDKEMALAAVEKRKQNIIIWSVVIVLLLVIVFAGLIFRSLRITRKQKITIEKQKQIVEDKNQLLNQKNEEITAQRDEIEAQSDIVIKQKEHIENIHKEQTSSIKYAKTIQESMLPDENIINEILSNYFILFMPRDIVSGDFYWFTKVKDNTIAIVADCTGHGVPGAFMSMLGIAFLNEIINKEQIISPDEVLNKLRDNVIKSLKQHGQADQSNDGMDISIIVIKPQESSPKNQISSEEQKQPSNSLLEVNSKIYDVEFAGANNPAWLVRTNSDFPNFKNLENLIELKPDKMPIGIGYNMNKFSKQTITCSSGDILYLMSDGFKDQFGENSNKKFLSKNLKQLLITHCLLPLDKQKEMLEKTNTDWKGNTEQTDDICIIGIKI